jgi:hypothetical protein
MDIGVAPGAPEVDTWIYAADGLTVNIDLAGGMAAGSASERRVAELCRRSLAWAGVGGLPTAGM